MNLLESPLEALAFNYVSFGIFTIVNNLWTWVAVITAAVSFWRIRNSSGATSYSVRPEQQPRNDQTTSGSQPVSEISPADSCIEPPTSASAPAAAPAPASLSVCDFKEVDGVTKGKFTLFYYEHEKEGDGELTVVKEWEDDFSVGCGEWWESLMRVRKGDMLWYSHQDLTVMNGNVVRLWDDCRRRERYSSCCAVW